MNLAQVHAALTYYYDHPKEIDAYIAEDEAWDERHERDKAEFSKQTTIVDVPLAWRVASLSTRITTSVGL